MHVAVGKCGHDRCTAHVEDAYARARVVRFEREDAAAVEYEAAVAGIGACTWIVAVNASVFENLHNGGVP
jgi:hypothetical protein